MKDTFCVNCGCRIIAGWDDSEGDCPSGCRTLAMLLAEKEKLEAEAARLTQEVERLKLKLGIAIKFIELVAHRGAGPLSHRIEAEETLAEIQAILDTTK